MRFNYFLILCFFLTGCETFSIRHQTANVGSQNQLIEFLPKLQQLGWQTCQAPADALCLYREKNYLGPDNEPFASRFYAQVKRRVANSEEVEITVRSTMVSRKALSEEAEQLAKQIKGVLAKD